MSESFNCMRDCQHREGVWNNSLRSARGCGLSGPGMPPVKARPTHEALINCRVNGVTRGSYYRGRYPDRRMIGERVLGLPIFEQNWQLLPEDPSVGCPGSWYRTPFIDSVDKYSRRRTENGGRVDNPEFTEADWLIRSAVRYLEGEEERWHAYIVDERNARAEREQAKQDAAPGRPARRRGR